mmetsp:Transcript_9915/g.21020  ORF Transcript_9915/g.21020 Transcript_9915/m.21020 type:complete len:216 (-) Transcript_9915:1737-2384(-)
MVRAAGRLPGRLPGRQWLDVCRQRSVHARAPSQSSPPSSTRPWPASLHASRRCRPSLRVPSRRLPLPPWTQQGQGRRRPTQRRLGMATRAKKARMRRRHWGQATGRSCQECPRRSAVQGRMGKRRLRISISKCKSARRRCGRWRSRWARRCRHRAAHSQIMWPRRCRHTAVRCSAPLPVSSSGIGRSGSALRTWNSSSGVASAVSKKARGNWVRL